MSGDCGEILDAGVQVKTEGGISGNKVCSVCGDLALGFNFNALTCESCKAFFRRNALKAKEFKCPFTESCVMTAITRRFCQRCRLQKCFSVGMRKEYIMSEEERLNKRHKIEQNRARKRAAASSDDVPGANASKRGRLAHKRSLSNAELSASGLEWSSGPGNDTQNSPANTQSQEGSPRQVSDSLSERLMEPFPSPTSASSAGSVPSPNSPPDSATVAASQNTEMIAMRDVAGAHKQISVITYPHHTSQVSENHHPQCFNNVSIPKVPFMSSSTQTSPDLQYSSTRILKTTATQTTEQPLSQRQSTPLLSSLISNQRADEAISTHQEASTSPPPTYDPLLMAEGTGGWKGVDGVNGRTVAWDSCAHVGGPEGNIDEDVLQDVFRIPVVPNSIESILSEAIKLEFSTYTPSSLSVPGLHPDGLPHSRELNDAERAKLNELIVANKALLAPLETRSDVADPRLLDIINLTAVAIRRLVKMAKKINAFKNMCQEDQVALLKGACMEMLILHSATTYNPVKDSWAIPQGTPIKVDVLKECKGNLYHEHRQFQRSFDPSWRTDENIMLILSAIALFTPDRPNIVHRDVIKLEQNSYYYLLRRYLECTLPGCEARSTFLKLIQKISELHRLNEEHVRGYLDVDPSEVEPLLIEIFDLKPPTVQ